METQHHADAQPRIIQNIKNNTMTAQHAMPHKEAVNDGTSSFEMGRKVFMNFVKPTNQTHKKWFSGTNRDASMVIEKRRDSQIGGNSLNVAGKAISFTNHNDFNTVSRHLRYVRGAGATVPMKTRVRSNPGGIVTNM